MLSVMIIIIIFHILDLNFLYSNPEKRSQVTLDLETKEEERRHVLVKIFPAYAYKESFGFKLVQAVHSIQGLQFYAFKKMSTRRWKETNLSVQSLNGLRHEVNSLSQFNSL